MKANNDSILNFDYIIIGSGVAGLQLALSIINSNNLRDKRIAIIDKVQKNANDKTFCFWEKGKGKWDQIVSKNWQETYCFGKKNEKLHIKLAPYTYKKIRSIDFYKHCIEKLKNNIQVNFFTESVKTVTETLDTVIIKTTKQIFECTHLFDSRLPLQFLNQKKNYSYIDQSFSGFEIETKSPVFEAHRFTMMDYRFTWQNSTSFMYILPKNTYEALIEYTFFAPFTLTKTAFESQIKKYIDTYFNGVSYTIKQKENGVIPMTNYPFEKHHTPRITKIGTAGGWVKASTGYSFKRSEKFVSAIIEQLINKQPVIGYLPHPRFKFYDMLLLKILEKENTKGPEIFFKMYKNTKPSTFFKFLDEETSLFEEIKLILKLPYFPFIKALFR